MSNNKLVIIAAMLVSLALLMSVILIPFGVFGSEEDSSGGGEDNDNGDTSENGGNSNNDDDEEPEEGIDLEVPEEPPIKEPVLPVEPEPCSPDQDECEPEPPIDPCLEYPDLDECQPGQPCDPTIDVNCVPEPDPCLENPDLDECLPSKCGPGTHLENGICVRDKGNAGSSSSSSTTITINAAEIYSCRLDGSSDGIQQKFNSIKYQACGLYPNGQLAYSDGFVMGCTQIGNTNLICQSLVNSSILNAKIQPTQTTQTVQAAQLATGVLDEN